jgi:hypothetical protein
MRLRVLLPSLLIVTALGSACDRTETPAATPSPEPLPTAGAVVEKQFQIYFGPNDSEGREEARGVAAQYLTKKWPDYKIKGIACEMVAGHRYWVDLDVEKDAKEVGVVTLEVRKFFPDNSEIGGYWRAIPLDSFREDQAIKLEDFARDRRERSPEE